MHLCNATWWRWQWEKLKWVLLWIGFQIPATRTYVAFHWHVTQQQPAIVLDLSVETLRRHVECVSPSTHVLRCVALSPPYRLLENSAILDQYKRASLTWESGAEVYTSMALVKGHCEPRRLNNVNDEEHRWEELSRNFPRASQLCNNAFVSHQMGNIPRMKANAYSWFKFEITMLVRSIISILINVKPKDRQRCDQTFLSWFSKIDLIFSLNIHFCKK